VDLARNPEARIQRRLIDFLHDGDDNTPLIVRNSISSVDDLCALSVTSPRELPESPVFAQPFPSSVCCFCQTQRFTAFGTDEYRTSLLGSALLAVDTHDSRDQVEFTSEVGTRLETSRAAGQETCIRRAPCYQTIYFLARLEYSPPRPPLSYLISVILCY
jgi:hypothetical protein